VVAVMSTDVNDVPAGVTTVIGGYFAAAEIVLKRLKS
jgi:hypothetical protein